MKTLYIISSALLLSGTVMAQTKGGKNIAVKEVKQKLDRSKRPQAGPAPEVKLGKAEKFVLPNGLTVFVVENHKIPKVSINLNLDIDPILEGDKAGYVSMAGSLLGTATKNMTKDQINEKVDFIGASLNANSAGASGSCLKKHLDNYMKIFSEVVLNPVFKQEELDKIKKQTLSGLISQKTDPNEMMSNLSKAVIYGKDHAYGEVQTEKNVENIKLEDCQNYYNSYFKPNIGYVTIVGDITVAEAKAMMEKYFNNWAKAEVKQNEIPSVPGPLANKVALVNKAGAAQSTIRITYPLDFKIGNPDEIKVRVMNEILGGGASARLFRNLRETYNFTYGAYSNVSTDEFIGNFTASADVRTVATDSAINEFLKEMVRIRSEKVSTEELEAAKKNMAGTFSIALESPSTIARFALNLEKYKLPADYYQTYLSKLAAVTADDVFEMAKKYIKPENAYILVVGDKEKVAAGLKKYSADGKVSFYDYKGDVELAIKPVPAGVTAQTVFDGYFAALGGKEALNGVKNQTMVMEGELQGMKITITSKKKLVETKKKKKVVLAIHKSYEEFAISGMGVMQKKTCDGVKAQEFNAMGGGNKMLEGKELEKALIDSRMNTELYYADLGYKTNLLGIETLETGDAYKIEVIEPSGDKSVEFYDVTTGFKMKTEAQVQTPQGTVNVASIYSDYKKVGNVYYPHTVTLDQGGMLIQSKVKTIDNTTVIPDDVFAVK